MRSHTKHSRNEEKLKRTRQRSPHRPSYKCGWTTDMLRLATDADVHGVVSRALEGWADDPPTLEPMAVGHEAEATAALEEANQKRNFVSVLDVLPEGTSDPEILEWAAREQRIVLTNDTNT